MDINEWEYYVPCSRLKTKRQKERLRKWDSDKQLRRLNAELKRLRLEQANLGFKELVPPVQRGWKRTFIVRPDVLKSKDGIFFATLLQKINTEQLSHRRDFKVTQRRKGKKIQAEQIQKLAEPDEGAFKQLKLTEKEKEYFTEVHEFYCRQQYRVKHVFNEPCYVLKVLPNMITKVKVIDPLLQQQEAEIANYLERSGRISRLHKVVYGKSLRRWHWHAAPKEKYQTIFKTESIAKLYAELYNEND